MTSQKDDTSIVPVVSPDVAVAVLDGEVVLHHFDTNVLLRLDRVGSLTWQCFDGVSTVDEIVGDLADAFEVDPSIVRADVGTLLEELAEFGAVELAEPPGPPENDRESAETPDDAPTVLTNPPSP